MTTLSSAADDIEGTLASVPGDMTGCEECACMYARTRHTARASRVMSDIEAAFGKYASRPTARSRARRTPRREALGTPPAADEMRQRAAVAIEEAERLADARVDKIRREAAETVERAEAERVDIDRRTRLLAGSGGRFEMRRY